tara:strand:+ start:269 stop:1123 length:855 start_codon:yes stop_codon:yes gene_type:complete
MLLNESKEIKPDTGWRAQLELEFSKVHKRTILSHRKHFGPLQVQKSFYPELNGTCHVYMLHPPGGVVGGDRLNISIDLNTNAHALITTPAAGKFYRSAGPVAEQEHKIKVASNSILEWFPSENILFSGAKARIHTKVNLAQGSHFLGWEISCLGRPASNEFFSQGELDQRFEVWREGRPLRIERLKIKGRDPALQARWGMIDFSVIGSMVCVTEKTGLVDSLRKLNKKAIDQELFSATQMESALLCYYLGNSAERARKYFVSAWKILRQKLIGCEAIEPRIWNT